MTLKEVATYLNINQRTLERYVAKGRIAFLRIGGTGPRRFRLADVDNSLLPGSTTDSEDDFSDFFTQQTEG